MEKDVERFFYIKVVKLLVFRFILSLAGWVIFGSKENNGYLRF